MMKQDSVSNRKVFRIDQILMPAYLCSLVLEPHLHDSHRQSSLSRQSFSDLQQQNMHEMYIRAVSTHNTRDCWPFGRVWKTPRRKPWRRAAVVWSGWFVVSSISCALSHHPQPSPQQRHHHPPHPHSLLQRETEHWLKGEESHFWTTLTFLLL